MNLRGVWQAAYTAGAVLPRPVATTQYWHRSLNPRKLIDVGFSRLTVSLTLASLPSILFASPSLDPERRTLLVQYRSQQHSCWTSASAVRAVCSISGSLVEHKNMSTPA